MMGEKCLLPLVAILTFLLSAKAETETTPSLKIVCYRQSLYYANGASNNENCSHVVLQVGSLDGSYGRVKQPYSFSFISEYKKKYPQIKVMLGLDPFDPVKDNMLPEVIDSKVGRDIVIRDAVLSVKQIGYDGIDLKFRDGYDYETAQVASGIRKAIGLDTVTLSGYFAWNASRDEGNADLAEIAKDLDFMTLECYKPTKTKIYTELVSPLYSSDGESVSSCIERILDLGAPRSKVLMAIQTYAVTSTLDDADQRKPGSPARYRGWSQYPSNKYGFLTLDQLHGPYWDFLRDEASNSPYAVNYLQWASYDDEISVGDKAKYIKEGGLGGAALTSYSSIDIIARDLPLLEYVYKYLRT